MIGQLLVCILVLAFLLYTGTNWEDFPTPLKGGKPFIKPLKTMKRIFSFTQLLSQIPPQLLLHFWSERVKLLQLGRVLYLYNTMDSIYWKSLASFKCRNLDRRDEPSWCCQVLAAVFFSFFFSFCVCCLMKCGYWAFALGRILHKFNVIRKQPYLADNTGGPSWTTQFVDIDSQSKFTSSCSNSWVIDSSETRSKENLAKDTTCDGQRQFFKLAHLQSQRKAFHCFDCNK